MLHLIPKPLHRSLFRLAHALRKRWWRLANPRLRGCRMIALDSAGRVLLIRQSYGSGDWLTPGGGLRRGDDPVAGALRELREETGCRLDDAVQVALLEERLHGARNAVHVVVGLTADKPRPDGREVIEAQFFALDALPEDMPPLLRGQLPQWVNDYATRSSPEGGGSSQER
jgi:8-oxo-dGTP pyrophosphatase MutT (NUDIX family)